MALSIQPTRVFWCEPTGRIRRSLRCYRGGADDPESPCRGYCSAMRPLDEVEEEFGDPIEDGRRFRVTYDPGRWPWDAFPTACEKCGRDIKEPTRQIFTDEILEVKTGPRVGERFARRDAPVGAMWEITHYREFTDWCGRDGLALNVVTPGGEWHVDSRANNCTKPDDKAHRCWVRRGNPRTGYVHVDKDATVQETCEAGAGSIWINKGGPRDWHGFLHRGFLCDADDRPKVDAMLDGAIANPVAPAERVLAPHRIDRPARVRPVVPPPVPVPRTGWRSNRGFQVRPKR